MVNEIVLKIPIDEVEKIIYAINHMQLTGDEHIDAVLDILNTVLKDELACHNSK